MSADVQPVALRDGRRVEIRPTAAADCEAVADFFAALARASLDAQRIAATRAGTRRQREGLVAHERGRGALLAVPADAVGPVVGFAGWVYLPEEESCELTLAVDEGWQDGGLGSALLQAVVRDARVEGYRHFHAEMHGGNLRMLGLLRDLVSPVNTRVQGGMVRVDFEVPE